MPEVKRTGRTWSVFVDGQLVEGGFFNRAAAQSCADALLKPALDRIKEAMSNTYQQCGPDLGWVDRTPSDAEFVSVICDLTWQRQTLSEADMKVWAELSMRAKRQLCLEVGP